MTSFTAFFRTGLAILLILASSMGIIGCGKGNVPNSTAAEIESAKFDAKEANKPSAPGAAMPPREDGPFE